MFLPWRFCPSHIRKHAGQCVSSFTISQLGVQEGERVRVLVVATRHGPFFENMFFEKFEKSLPFFEKFEKNSKKI
jgi:hypothetical protein